MPSIHHDIEIKIVNSLKKDAGSQDVESLCHFTKLSEDQVRRGMEWLRLKGIATVTGSESTSLGKNGLEALESGLPERRLISLLGDGPKEIRYLQEQLGAVFGPAMGTARAGGWVGVSGTSVSLLDPPERLPGEDALERIGKKGVPSSLDIPGLGELRRRPGFIITNKATRMISLKSDPVDTNPAGSIDVEAGVPEAPLARTHPLSDAIAEVREAFVRLGFAEIGGPIIQPSFWNFDALFTPQDHPAREMQDTFYLDAPPTGRPATARQVRAVSQSHEQNWGYRWDARESRRAVLRTHTTCVTIRHLADARPDEARLFSLGRVFRNEKASYKHLAEFHQVEGVVAGGDVTLRGLMGIQREFYRMIGLERVKFWPTFFPYTEPSLQAMVYSERLGKWVELFGMGVFRPEVTRPLGIPGRVLAWGGGIERIAMLKCGIEDVRELYSNRLSWLRGHRRCR